MNQQQAIDIIINTKSLQKSLNIFQNILEKKSLISVFSNIKIHIIQNKIIFTGMNLDLSVINQAEIVNLMNNEVSLLVSVFVIYDVIRKINDEEIQIKKQPQNNFLEILTKNLVCKISLQSNENFPEIDLLEENYEYEIEASSLNTAIESVITCSAINDARNFLCAIKIIQNNEKIEFICTDGHRMAYFRQTQIQFINKNNLDENSLEIILPRKTANFILKYLKEDLHAKLKVRISKQKIIFFFEKENLTIFSKLIEGKYPNYQKLLNFEFDYKIKICVKKITETLERALIFLDNKNSKAINFQILPNVQQVVLTTQSDELGMIKEIIDQQIEIISNSKNDISSSVQLNINAYYFYEILKSIKNPMINMGIIDGKKPIAFSDVNFEEKIYLLMPMIF